MCEIRRESYAGRCLEMKCQAGGCQEQGILIEHRGLRFPERRVHLQARLGNFEYVLSGPSEQRRSIRNKRDPPVETIQSGAESSSRRSVRKEVSFGHVEDIANSDSSALSTPDLLDFEGWGHPSKRASDAAATSGSCASPEIDAHHHQNDHMTTGAADFATRRSRRNSMPAYGVRAQEQFAAKTAESTQPQPTGRQKAYGFDDSAVNRLRDGIPHAPDTPNSQQIPTTIFIPLRMAVLYLVSTQPRRVLYILVGLDCIWQQEHWRRRRSTTIAACPT